MSAIAGVLHGSTDLLHEGFGAYSSRSVVMGGNAIVDTAAKLRQALREEAAKRLGCEPSEIFIGEQDVRALSGRMLALSAFAGLVADGTFESSKRTYSYGAHAAEVAVDPETGHVALLDYAAVEDVGRIINPATLHGQTLGAIVQGLGGVLLEELIYGPDGQPLTTGFADYLLPTSCDFPRIDVHALQLHPSPLNPLGAKGAGEGGIIPVAGVIANAVAAALQHLAVVPNALPLSPANVHRLICEAEARLSAAAKA